MRRLPGGWLHLARRFVGSLGGAGPTPDDEAELIGLLNPAELRLYRSQSPVDRRHSVACAGAVGEAGDATLVVASAMHDVGKTEADVGTIGRVAATVTAAAAGRRRTERWRTMSGWRGRVGRYDWHDVRGAELLSAAGSDELVVCWAREHHLAPAARTLAPEVAARLERADRS